MLNHTANLSELGDFAATAGPAIASLTGPSFKRSTRLVYDVNLSIAHGVAHISNNKPDHSFGRHIYGALRTLLYWQRYFGLWHSTGEHGSSHFCLIIQEHGEWSRRLYKA